VTLSHEVECDEAYVIAGHKGQPEVVKTKRRKGRRRRLQGPCQGYFLETHGTIFHGKQAGVELIVRVLACLAEGSRIIAGLSGVNSVSC
jgi:hypothetical protein